jgi:SAM-dependent methyltransferase
MNKLSRKTPKFRKVTEDEIKRIDLLQSEYFTKSMRLFDPPLPEGVPERLEQIVECARISHSDTVLDIGTGTGILIPLIKEHTPAQIYANDLSEGMLKSVKEHHPDVETIYGDIRDLRLPGGCVDVVFINACYSNIVDKHRSFINIRRMLRQGGRVVISHPMGRSFTAFLKEEMPFPVDDFPEDQWEAGALFEPYGLVVSDLISEDKLYILVLKATGQ